VTARALVLGIDSDRLFPLEHQRLIASLLPSTIDDGEVVVISSPFGHDGFLIEDELVGAHLNRLLRS
jgi:homoserine O-acetyltransferase